MSYINIHKKKELEKKGNLGLFFILKKLSDSKYASETAARLNEIIKEYGCEKAKTAYYKALKKNPNLPKPCFFIKEGIFVDYSVNVKTEMFISPEKFFKNPEEYIQKHEKIKNKESKRLAEFEEKRKIMSDINYRFKKLDNYTDLNNAPSFYLYLHNKGFGKIVKDNSYISTVQTDKRFFVVKGYLEGEMNTIIKNTIEDNKKEISGFPTSFGYSYFGYKKAKNVFVVNDIYEIEKLVTVKNIKNLDFFFSENKFILLNGAYNYTLMYSGNKKRKDFLNTFLNDPLTAEFISIDDYIIDEYGIKEIVKDSKKYNNIVTFISHLKRKFEISNNIKKHDIKFNTP